MLAIVYDCRVLKPFGLPVGQSLLPILNAAGNVEFAAMSTVISVALLATFLYVCIEFEDAWLLLGTVFFTRLWTLVASARAVVTREVKGQKKRSRKKLGFLRMPSRPGKR